jgi:hypothetical protein
VGAGGGGGVRLEGGELGPGVDWASFSTGDVVVAAVVELLDFDGLVVASGDSWGGYWDRRSSTDGPWMREIASSNAPMTYLPYDSI